MELLLDTHAFLWWVDGTRRLPQAARTAIADPSNDCRVSLASCWEMAIKVGLGKLRLPEPLERFLPEQLAANGFRLLSIDLGDVVRVATLPFHHRDPFDRLLAAQALDGGLAIVSADPIFRRYGVRRVW